MTPYPPQQPQQQPPKQEAEPTQGAQLPLSDAEKLRLVARIEADKLNATADHQKRMRRFTRYEESWRRKEGMPGGEEGKSNFSVPLIKWQMFGKLAKETEALLGDDSQVIAVPTGPTDTKTVGLVGCFMTWLVFTAMKITKPLAIFSFRKLLNGRAHAYCPYEQHRYNHPTKGRVLYAEGPLFQPIDPDDLIVPAEDALSIQDFSFVIRRYLETPNALLIGEQEGEIYQGISENWREILQAARNDHRRDAEIDTVKAERDYAEGVEKQNPYSNRECLQVWEWYGRWRMEKSDAGGQMALDLSGDKSEGELSPADPNTDGYKYNDEDEPVVAGAAFAFEGEREMHETDLLIRYLPQLRLIIGAQRLDELYPDTPHKRPIVEANLVNDGSYWGPSLPELLEDAEAELTVNHNMATEAGQMTVGPLVFYRPGSGMDPKVFRYEPNMAIPSDNPNDDVKVVQISPNMQYSQLQQANLLAMVERLTGISDSTLGRTSDRPNQPRTARGQMMLTEAGDVRVNLDTRMLCEDFAEILLWFWELETMFAPAELFFRVTEDDAKGLLSSEIKDGFTSINFKDVLKKAGGSNEITAQERAGRFDFRLQLATTAHSREQKKQELVELIGLAMQSPIVMQNPAAQYHLMVDLFKGFGLDFTKYSDQPAPPFTPIDPKQEWTLILEGEDVHVNPLDNDEQHIADHEARVMKMGAAPPDQQDGNAIEKMIDHTLEHKRALIQKRQAQVVFNSLMTAMSQRGQEQPGQQPGQPGQQGAPDASGLLQAVGGGAAAPQLQGGLSGLPPGQEPATPPPTQ